MYQMVLPILWVNLLLYTGKYYYESAISLVKDLNTAKGSNIILIFTLSPLCIKYLDQT